MKHYFLLPAIFLLFIVGLYIPASYSQNPCPNVAPFDYEGTTYHTVAIGDQCWLKENLNVGFRMNSNQYPSNNGLIERYCYANAIEGCWIFGGLYIWDEAMQYANTEGTQGICPTGWHIPTTAEFQTLATAVNNDGNALKKIGQGGTGGPGTNISGFSALLAGMRDGNGSSYWLGTFGIFWSSSSYLDVMGLRDNDDLIWFGTYYSGSGCSVRCVNDLSVYDLSLLPVELNLFTAIPNGRTIQLNWETKTEKNSDKFNIERKTFSTNFEIIDSVKASVLSNSPKQYSFTDKKLQSGKYQYRLKMIDNDGTFKYSSVSEAEVAVPNNYELSQNFPNPFNPSTVISYSLPTVSNVKLIIFNSLGQTVKVLEKGFKNAGSYSVNFNATELSSGTYFYKIEAGQFSQIKKMILLK